MRATGESGGLAVQLSEQKGKQDVIGTAAQVSLYPLGQESLAPAIDEALRIFRKHGLEVEPGAMSSLITGDDDAIFAALQEAFAHVAGQGRVVMVATFSNACPVPPQEEREPITYEAIGRVENDFDISTPMEEMRSGDSRIILDPTLTAGLDGLEPGRRLAVVFSFHRSQGYALKLHPRGDRSRPLRGVFATCSPNRPNGIGVTVVDLLAIDGNVLRVRGLDAIDGTPVLDLKPA
jgi:tRNA-Thr(GGU) m(6)t(6)A37 methyltransferase TsaA